MTFAPPTLKLTDEGELELELPHLGCSLLIKPLAKCPVPPAVAVIDTTGVELSNVIAFPTRAA